MIANVMTAMWQYTYCVTKTKKKTKGENKKMIAILVQSSPGGGFEFRLEQLEACIANQRKHLKKKYWAEQNTNRTDWHSFHFSHNNPEKKWWIEEKRL